MRPFFSILRIAAAGFCLIGCFKSTEVAGGTSETTNGESIATILYADGAPAARVRVLIVDDEDWLGKIAEGNSVILDSSFTNAKGTVRLNMPAANRCNLQIDGVKQGLFVRDIRTRMADPDARKFSLAPYGSLSGRAVGDSGAIVEKLFLAGTTYSAAVKADSTYAFDAVAAGTFTLVADVRRGGIVKPVWKQSIEVLPGAGIADQNVADSLPRILVDDFTAGLGTNLLGRGLGGGFWSGQTDVEVGGNSAITMGTVTDSDAYSGPTMHVVYNLGPLIPKPYALIGFDIGKSRSVYDLSKMKAVSFWAKGSGSLILKFFCRTDTQTDTAYEYYSHAFKLQPAWIQVVIPVDSLIPVPTVPKSVIGLTWKEIGAKTVSMHIGVESPLPAQDSVSLWLDDLYFEGLYRKDVVQTGL